MAYANHVYMQINKIHEINKRKMQVIKKKKERMEKLEK